MIVLKTRNNSTLLTSFLSSLFYFFCCSNVVMASGFDKPVLWSGRYGGVGGASVSFVEGPESLAFNPAGLALEKDAELTLAVSPFLTQRQSPVVTDSWGKTSFVAAGAILYSKKIQDGFGLGFGVYASGGGANDMGNIDFGSAYPTLHPPVDTASQFLEFALGAGYEVSPGFRVGASWRVLNAKATLHVAGASPSALTAYSFQNLSDTNWGAYRLGAQYEPESKNWGAGLTYRSSVPLHASGTSSGQLENSGSSTVTPLTGGNITLATVYPWQLAAGTHVALTQKWRLMAEYNFTHYSSVDRFVYSGDPIGGVDPSLFSVQTNWMNLHVIRLGTEVSLLPQDLVLRGGWTFLTQVTPTDRSSFITLPPSSGQGFMLGAGSHALQDCLALDLALDYSEISGDASHSQPGFFDGHYVTWAFTIHTSSTYRF